MKISNVKHFFDLSLLAINSLVKIKIKNNLFEANFLSINFVPNHMNLFANHFIS